MGWIRLEDDDPIIVEKMIRFIYTTRYTDEVLPLDPRSSQTQDVPLVITPVSGPKKNSMATNTNSTPSKKKSTAKAASSTPSKKNLAKKCTIPPPSEDVNPSTCPDCNGPCLTEISPFITNAMVYNIAKKYEIPGLKVLATKRYKEGINKHWHIRAFVESMCCVYEDGMESDKPLKDIMIDAVLRNLMELMTCEPFLEFLRQEAELGVDILLRCLDKGYLP